MCVCSWDSDKCWSLTHHLSQLRWRWGNNLVFSSAIWKVISSDSSLLLAEMIAEKIRELHSGKIMRLLRRKLLSCRFSFMFRFDDFIIWYTFCFLIRWSQNVSGAPYAAELTWTHYFSFDIISIQTCQPVQIGLQTVPSRTLELSTVTNERPALWRISQSEARTGEDVCVTTIFHVPSDFLLPCHTQQQST